MDKIDILQKSPLFENLLNEELAMVSELSVQKNFMAGDVVITQGEPGDALFIIAGGEFEALVTKPGHQAVLMSVLRPFDFFGEMSLIDKKPRSATVKARTDGTVISLSTANLHSFAKVYKNGFTMTVINIAKVLSARLRETSQKLAETGTKT